MKFVVRLMMYASYLVHIYVGEKNRYFNKANIDYIGTTGGIYK